MRDVRRVRLLVSARVGRPRARAAQVFAARRSDKLHFRYPGAGGESYRDVIDRVRPIIIELERQRRSVVVVSHLAVQACDDPRLERRVESSIQELRIPLTPRVEFARERTHLTCAVNALESTGGSSRIAEETRLLALGCKGSP